MDAQAAGGFLALLFGGQLANSIGTIACATGWGRDYEE